jgi:hypothetical protein
MSSTSSARDVERLERERERGAGLSRLLIVKSPFSILEPLDAVDLGDVVDRHRLDRTMAAQPNESINIQAVEAAEGVLLAHETRLTANGEQSSKA